jgi:GR25 family glycosyltransferase involved in LPS biosynthesis
MCPCPSLSIRRIEISNWYSRDMSSEGGPGLKKSSDTDVLVAVLGVRGNFRGAELLNELFSHGIPVVRIDGFDAKTNEIPSDWKNSKRSHFMVGRDLTNTEIACSWGHMQALEVGHRLKTNWILVIEDNVASENLYRICQALDAIALREPTLISFFSAAEYNLSLGGRSVIKSLHVKRALSIPTGTKCYAVNRSGQERLVQLYQRYGFQGYQADFPLFFGTGLSILTCSTFKIRTIESKSLIGERSHLKKQHKIRRIYSKDFGSILSWVKSEDVGLHVFARFTVLRSLAKLIKTL